MITQAEYEEIFRLPKFYTGRKRLFYPPQGEVTLFDVSTQDGMIFQVDIRNMSRKSLGLQLWKSTYQERYEKTMVMARLDIGHGQHTNPDGTIVSGNHLHLYHEKYNDHVAIPLPENFSKLLSNKLSLIKEFFCFCHIEFPPEKWSVGLDYENI